MYKIGDRVGLALQWLQVIGVRTSCPLPLLCALGGEDLPLLRCAQQKEEVACRKARLLGPCSLQYTHTQACTHTFIHVHINIFTCILTYIHSHVCTHAHNMATPHPPTTPMGPAMPCPPLGTLTDEVGGVGDLEEVRQIQPLDEGGAHGDSPAPAPWIVCGGTRYESSPCHCALKRPLLEIRPQTLTHRPRSQRYSPYHNTHCLTPL